MSEADAAPDAGAEEARRLVEEHELGARDAGIARWLIPMIAAAWSLFQLAVPAPFLSSILSVDSVYVRSAHLVFAIVLVYLSFPALRSKRISAWMLRPADVNAPPRSRWFRAALNWKGRWLTSRRISLLDLLLAVIAGCAAAYYAFDYNGIAERSGLPLTRDLVAGVVLAVLLIEAARRALGPALPIVATAFLLYALFAQQMPQVLAFRSVSLERLVGQLSMSTQGIYGMPLYVSATTVFLFVLFGAMLEKTGGGEFFVRLAFALLGGFKGGPAKAAVLGSGLTGMVSGSSIANVVTTGTFTIPLMKRAGYPAEKAAAIEVAASTNGQLMPPIMGAAAFIIAEFCAVPYIEVVRAAFIPAICSYLALIYITHLEASKLGLKGVPRDELPQARIVLLEGMHFLVPLAFLLYCLIIRRYSPELSAFWAILVLAATAAAYNAVTVGWRGDGWGSAAKLTARQLWDSLVAGGRNMMSIGVAVAAAGIIVGVVSLGPGDRITSIVESVSGGNIYAILLLTAFASLLLGMGLPTTANYIVMASLTAPVIVELAGDSGYVVPILAAHLFVFFFGILADDTPPVGLAAYAAAAIARSKPMITGVQGFIYDMRTAILPFMFFFNTDLLLMGVEGWRAIVVVFLTCLAGMFAFASATQGWMLAKNRWWETVMLIVATVLLLQPLIVGRVTGWEVLAEGIWAEKWVWRGIGVGAMGVVFGMQWGRKKAVV